MPIPFIIFSVFGEAPGTRSFQFAVASCTQGPLGADSPSDAAHRAAVCFGQAEPFSQARLSALEATCLGLFAVGLVYINTNC